MSPSDARLLLLSPDSLAERGIGRRGLARALAAGELVRVHGTHYAEGPVWRSLFREEQHLLRVTAAHDDMRGGDAVFVLVSAAVLHGLPLYGPAPRFVHVAGRRTDGDAQARARQVSRHRVRVPDADRTVVDGMPCTTIERTVFDLARLARRPCAVAVADAMLRSAAWSDADRRYDVDAAEGTRSGLTRRACDARGARGVVQGRFVVAFADGRAQLPGESVSRYRLHELGFAPPRLQVAVPGPHGDDYAIDFGLDDVDSWGEFDGEGKYLRPELTGGRAPLEVLAREKEREDWIRGTTGRRFVRWGSAHVTSSAALAARLAAFSILPPP